ncbi:hypothetical protein [Nonomuraea sp. NPDC050643]|uniref:hypothetical protein n=1 Tax=Nonomuraea sp. NPDC050643 TaxID=3155660 RepID=UPI0033D5B4DC
MSMHEQQYPPVHDHTSPSGAAPGRPAALTRAVGAAIAAAALNLVSAAGILISGMQVVREQIASSSSGETRVTPEMVDPSSERAQSLHTIYSSMAYGTIFWSLVLILLAWLALRGGRATRIFSVVILIISLLVKALDLLIAMPVLALICDALFAVVALAAIVLLFRSGNTANRRRTR